MYVYNIQSKSKGTYQYWKKFLKFLFEIYPQIFEK